MALTARDQSGQTGSVRLKAAILDVATGAVEQRFDWPIHERGSTVRVVRGSELLVQRGDLLQIMTTDGKPKTALRIVKVNSSDQTLINLSPAVDPIVVVEGSNLPRETVNGVAILDSRNLQVLADFHDNGEIWNIAASSKVVVRTSGDGARLELREFSEGKLGESWRMIWSGSKGISRPVFLNDETLAYAVANVVMLFTAAGKPAQKIECHHAARVQAAGNGNALAAVCLKVGGQRVGVNLGEVLANTIEVYRLSPFAPLGSVPLDSDLDPGFDFALSPTGAKVAVVERLHLRLFELP
jgi:hypothetical protein